MRRSTVVLAAMAIGLLSACDGSPAEPESAPDALVFAGIPTGSSDTVLTAFKPIIEMLRKETGREIRVQDTRSYSDLIEEVRAGRIDIATFGPLSYVLAKQKGAQVTAVGAQTKDRGQPSPGYTSFGITGANSPIRSLADLRGRKVCFVDRESTSGYLYPSAALLEVGIHPTEGTQPVFAGGHEAVVLAVANGQCEAGFAYDEMVDRQLIEQGQLQAGQVTKIWESDTIPGAPLAISDRLPPELRDTLTRAIRTKANADYLRANGFCQGECPVGDADAYGYRQVDDNFYDPVRKVCEITHHETCTTA